jgi:hypothetical protein
MARHAVGQLAEGGAGSDLPPGKHPVIITDARWTASPRGDDMAELTVLGLGTNAGKRAGDRLFLTGATAKILASFIRAAMHGYPGADTLALDTDLDGTLRAILMGRVVVAEIGQRTYQKKDGTEGTATSLLGAGPLSDDAAPKAYASANWSRWWSTTVMVHDRAVSPADLVYEAALQLRDRYPDFLPPSALAVGPPEVVDVLRKTLSIDGAVSLPDDSEVPF